MRAQLWVVAQCCGWQPSPIGATTVPASMLEAKEKVVRECLGEGDVLDHCRTSRYQWERDALPYEEAERNYLLNDWLLVAPSSTLDSFGAIFGRYIKYLRAVEEIGIRKRRAARARALAPRRIERARLS